MYTWSRIEWYIGWTGIVYIQSRSKQVCSFCLSVQNILRKNVYITATKLSDKSEIYKSCKLEEFFNMKVYICRDMTILMCFLFHLNYYWNLSKTMAFVVKIFLWLVQCTVPMEWNINMIVSYHWVLTIEASYVKHWCPPIQTNDRFPHMFLDLSIKHDETLNDLHLNAIYRAYLNFLGLVQVF